jgi:hypothetical protein
VIHGVILYACVIGFDVVRLRVFGLCARIVAASGVFAHLHGFRVHHRVLLRSVISRMTFPDIDFVTVPHGKVSFSPRL